jgi:hypothetical protein
MGSLRGLRALLTLLGVAALTALPARAQRSEPVGARRDSAVTDTAARKPVRRIPSSIPDSLLRPPITPKAAFLRSLALPGWGQTGLRRSTAALLFSVVEVGSLYMVGKSRADLRRARALSSLDSLVTGDPSRTGAATTRAAAIDQGLINARRLQVEDWLAILFFNHLLSGADAYVAANLWDLPARVSIQHTPGGTGIGARVHW